MTEQSPPPEKRSFAPTEEEMKKQQQIVAQPVKEIPSAEVSLYMMSGKLDVIIEELKTLNSLFKYTKTAMSQNMPTTPIPASTPASELSPRMKEILSALKPVEDLLKIDNESSTMMVMVRPAQYLGSDNFSKVAAIVRGLDGQYVSAGKNSHFEIPKAPRKA